MGRVVFKSKKGDLEACKRAMALLHQRAVDRACGLPEDPVPVFDLAGKLVTTKGLALKRYARGPHAGFYVLCGVKDALHDTRRSETLIAARTLKEAVSELLKAARKIKPRVPKKTYVGAPLIFDAGSSSSPSDFGGNEETGGVSPHSITWDVIVENYARWGTWCKTARLIWADKLPTRLVEQAENYRKQQLVEP
jgi:hypothetical protein